MGIGIGGIYVIFLEFLKDSFYGGYFNRDWGLSCRERVDIRFRVLGL